MIKIIQRFHSSYSVNLLHLHSSLKIDFLRNSQKSDLISVDRFYLCWEGYGRSDFYLITVHIKSSTLAN